MMVMNDDDDDDDDDGIDDSDHAINDDEEFAEWISKQANYWKNEGTDKRRLDPLTYSISGL